MSRTNDFCLPLQCHAGARACPERRAAGANAEGFARLIRLVCLWQERMRERAHLATLPDYLLRDMGLTRADAVKQSALQFWKA
jgi:uncharacterized protein YjiS (DUF1127 family)